MLTLSDLIAFSGLSEGEVLAIAEHEHIPEALACSLAGYLSRNEDGEIEIRDMIIDDIRGAQARKDREHTRKLLHVLHHYLRAHPSARPQNYPWSSLL